MTANAVTDAGTLPHIGAAVRAAAGPPGSANPLSSRGRA